jgi:hypothetical protein
MAEKMVTIDIDETTRMKVTRWCRPSKGVERFYLVIERRKRWLEHDDARAWASTECVGLSREQLDELLAAKP